MKLEMIKGKESSLIIEDAIKSIMEDGFLADSYLKAFHALCDYATCSDSVRMELQSGRLCARDITLYLAPQNIIAFSGKRGSGKSSSMLSFSEVLGNPKKIEELCDHPKNGQDYSVLKSKHFIVLDPIDPTTLEKNQSILSVILSRLIFRAEENWNRHTPLCSGFQDRERIKTDLLTLARQCLNGINAIKSKEDVSRDLAELQKVGDSSILKRNLYDFVEVFLQFENLEKHISSANANYMLVIQFDDTDCQITQGYEIMEDIRKYLTIPNTLILMATDIKQLRRVLVQHYVSDFYNNLQYSLVKVKEINHFGEKYLTKLMPPSQVVHLPDIDDIIREQLGFIHLYYYESEEKKQNLLDSEYEKYDFQSVILRYIYKKTHIVFSAHDAYANNIIPTTLRGLAYFLNQLSSMEDIQEIDLSKELDAKGLADALENQIPILERNINLFEEYFLHDWISAKLTQDMIEIIEKFSNQAPDQRVPFIFKELADYYMKQEKEKSLNVNSVIAGYGAMNYYDSITYADLDKLLRIIQGTICDSSYKEIQFRQPEDFYFVFAIRTLLTIKNNKDILRVKRKAINNYTASGEEPIAFNYLKVKTSLPTDLYLDPVQLFGHNLIKDFQKDNQTHIEHFQKRYFHTYQDTGGITKTFNFTGGIIEWLAPKEDDYKDFDQRKLYMAQELAVLTAANCDAQELARKAVARKAKENGQTNSPSFSDAVDKALQLVQNAVADINNGMLSSYKADIAGGSVWKVNSQIKDCLNLLQELAPKTKENILEIPYSIFNYDIPQFMSERINILHEKVKEYEKELKAYAKQIDKPLSNEIKNLLSSLLSFEFKSADGIDADNSTIINGNEFDEIRNQLKQKLDQLFSNDADD